jgi:ribonuclease HI
MKNMLIEVYTDGACTQGAFMPWPGGYAAIILINGEPVNSIQNGKFHTTNNEMELMAFLAGLELANNERIYNDFHYDIIIYTDSAYIYNCFKQKWYEKWINNGWITSDKQPVKNQDLWMKIINLFYKLNIKIEKVKAHKDNKYNNYVDQLAVEAKERVVKDYENNSNIR